MMNFWKQTTHVMAYFNTENFRGADRLPDSFMKGFLEVRKASLASLSSSLAPPSLSDRKAQAQRLQHRTARTAYRYIR